MPKAWFVPSHIQNKIIVLEAGVASWVLSDQEEGLARGFRETNQGERSAGTKFEPPGFEAPPGVVIKARHTKLVWGKHIWLHCTRPTALVLQSAAVRRQLEQPTIFSWLGSIGGRISGIGGAGEIGLPPSANLAEARWY